MNKADPKIGENVWVKVWYEGGCAESGPKISCQMEPAKVIKINRKSGDVHVIRNTYEEWVTITGSPVRLSNSEARKLFDLDGEYEIHQSVVQSVEKHKFSEVIPMRSAKKFFDNASAV